MRFRCEVLGPSVDMLAAHLGHENWFNIAFEQTGLFKGWIELENPYFNQEAVEEYIGVGVSDVTSIISVEVIESSDAEQPQESEDQLPPLES